MSISRPASPWPAALACSSLAVALGVFGGLAGPTRPIVALWFLAVCPGMALVGLLDIEESLTRAVLAVATSIALDAIISIIGIYVGGTSFEDVLVVLIIITLAGAAAQALPVRMRVPRLVPRHLLTSVAPSEASSSDSDIFVPVAASPMGDTAISPAANLESRREAAHTTHAMPAAGAQVEPTVEHPELGVGADATTIAAITSTVRDLLAFANQGAFLQGFMLYSPDFYRRFRAEIGLSDAEFRAEFGGIQPRSQEDQSEIAAVRNVRMLRDGRVFALISYSNPMWAAQPPEESYTFVRFPEADYWLVDDITPLAEEDSSSAAADQQDRFTRETSTADSVVIDP